MNPKLYPRQMKNIHNFLKFFKKNEAELYKAFKASQTNTLLLLKFQKKIFAISKRLDWTVMDDPSEAKLKCIISARGYPKRIPIVTAIQRQVQALHYFTMQLCFHPYDKEDPTFSKSLATVLRNTRILPLHYNLCTKKMILLLHVEEAQRLQDEYPLHLQGELLLLFTLGEFHYRRHILEFYCESLLPNTKGLQPLAKLPKLLEELGEITPSKKIKILFE